MAKNLTEDLIRQTIQHKLAENIKKINELIKMNITAETRGEVLEKASKKQLTQMTGDREVASWINQHLKRDDVALWFARAYKKDPSVFNDKNKINLQHYGSMLDQHKELQDLRLDRSHDFDKGMHALKSANEQAEERYKNKDSLIEPDENTKKIMDTKDGYAWYSLGKGSCGIEGKAMGHCGNTADTHEDDNILSLRKEKHLGDKVYHEPHLTFINNNGHLGEMKGKANDKPAEKYHEHITPLLESDHVQGIMGGGYEAHKNFDLDDLSEEDRTRILEKKPDIDPLSRMKKIDPNTVPEKHKKDIEDHNNNVDIMNRALKEHGDLDTIMNEGESDAKEIVLSHRAFKNHVTKEYIDRAFSDEDPSVRGAAVRSKHFGPEHMDKALRDENLYNREAAVKSKHFGPEHVDKVLNDDEDDLTKYNVVRSKHFGPEHMDKALSDKGPLTRYAAVESKHFGPEHFDRAFNDKDQLVRRAAVNSKHFGPEHFDKALNDKHESVREATVNSKYFGPEHMDKALNDKHELVRQAAVKSKLFGPEYMDKVLNDDEDELTRYYVVRSKHFGPEHFDRAFSDKSPLIRHAAVESKHFGPEHFDRAFSDEDQSVREAAVNSKHFGPEHMDKALNDKHENVRRAAVNSKHFGPEHFDRAFSDEDPSVRGAAVRSKHFGPEYMDKALSDKDKYVRVAAVNSKHFGPEHFDRALNDKHELVRTAAARQIDAHNLKP